MGYHYIKGIYLYMYIYTHIICTYAHNIYITYNALLYMGLLSLKPSVIYFGPIWELRRRIAEESLTARAFGFPPVIRGGSCESSLSIFLGINHIWLYTMDGWALLWNDLNGGHTDTQGYRRPEICASSWDPNFRTRIWPSGERWRYTICSYSLA